MLLRGTDLYERRDEMGLVQASEIAHPLLEELRVQRGIPHVVASPSFSQSDWYEMANMAADLLRREGGSL